MQNSPDKPHCIHAMPQMRQLIHQHCAWKSFSHAAHVICPSNGSAPVAQQFLACERKILMLAFTGPNAIRDVTAWQAVASCHQRSHAGHDVTFIKSGLRPPSAFSDCITLRLPAMQSCRTRILTLARSSLPPLLQFSCCIVLRI